MAATRFYFNLLQRFFRTGLCALLTAHTLVLPLMLLSGMLLLLPTSASAQTPPSITEIEKYLVVGMHESGSDAFNNNSSNELGANRSFLSGTDPNTHSTFSSRWSGAGASVGPQPSTEEPISGQPDGTPTGAAPVFQGIDWSGNVAITSPTSRFSLANIQVFADLGVQGANPNSSLVQSVSGSDYFADMQTTANSGGTPGNETGGDLDTASGLDSDGLEGGVDLSQLLTDLGLWRTYIQGLTKGTDSKCTITSDISSATEVNYDSCDDDGDGIAVIDIDRGGSDFNVDHDWIIEGSGNVLFIFRIRGGTNMLMSNGSILLGDGGIGNGSATQAPDELGAIFVKAFPNEEGTGSSDQVFNADNVVLNGVAFWDLVEIGTGQSSATEISISNGQGCAQFISTKVLLSNTRWTRCSLALPTLPTPDIQIVKRANGDDANTCPGVSVAAGSTVTYTFEVTNTGGVPLTNVQVVDNDLTPPFTNTIGSLAVGQMVTVSTTRSAPAAGVQFQNTATASGQGNSTTVTDTDPACVTVPGPAIQIVKRANGDDANTCPGVSVAAGANVTYTFEVTNTGDVPLMNVTVVDNDLSPAFSQNIGTLLVGQSTTLTTVRVAPAAGVTFQNTASVSGQDSLGTTVNDSDPACITTPPPVNPAIQIIKRANGDDANTCPGVSVAAGANVTYTFEVTNTGNVDLTNVQVVDNDLSPAFTDTIASLTVGQSVTLTTTRPAPAAGMQFMNTATASGQDSSGTMVSDTDPACITTPGPAITIEKLANGDPADACPGVSVAPGSTVTYTFQVTNSGDVPLTNVQVVDNDLTPPFTDTIGNLSVGQMVTLTTTRPAPAAGVQFQNTATASGQDSLGTTVNDTDPACVTTQNPSIQIIKRANGEDANTCPGVPVAEGSMVTYTFEVTNNGDVPLTNVQVVDNDLTPPFTDTIGNLAVNQTVTLTTMRDAPASGVQFLNTATASGQDSSGTTVNDTDPACVTTPSVAAPAIDLEKFANGQDADNCPGVTVGIGSIVTYLFVVTNTGNAPLENVVLVDNDIPFTHTFGNLAVGESKQITTTLTAPSAQFQNTATVTGQDSSGTMVEDDDPACISPQAGGGPNTCPMNPQIASQCTQCVTNDTNVLTDCPALCPNQPPLGAPCFNTLQGAVDNAVASGGGLVCVFENTNENVVIGNNVDVRIEQCRHSRITAADPFAPVITVAADAGDMNPANNTISSKDILINSLEVLGGSAGILVQNNSTELKSIKARDNVIGIQIDGNTNLVKNSDMDANTTGLQVNGSNNDIISGNKARFNFTDGHEINGDRNYVQKNSAEDNGGAGFLVTGMGNELKDNKSNKNLMGFQLSTTATQNILWKNKAESNTLAGFQVNGDMNQVGTRRTNSSNTAKKNQGDGIVVTGGENLISRNRTECNLGDGIDISDITALNNVLGDNQSCRNDGDEFNVVAGNTGNGRDKVCGKKVLLPGVFDGPGRSCSGSGGSGGSHIPHTPGGGGTGTNRAPTPSIRTEFLTRNTGLDDLIELDGSKSKDRDGFIAEYCFRVEDRRTGATVLPETCVSTASIAVTLGIGEFTVYLDVIDDQGLRSTRTARRNVRDN